MYLLLHHSLKKEYAAIIEILEQNPVYGTALGNNCYKIRIAINSKGKGKSGGGRIITHVQILHNSVYLLSIYDKSKKENITNKELKLMLTQIKS